MNMHKLVSGLVGLLVVSACRGGESEKPPVHLIHNMDSQEKSKAYRKDTSEVFPNGRYLQTPPEGTVAWGQLDEDDHFFKGLDAQGQPAVEFPAALKDGDKAKEALVARGALRYQVFCAPCHGELADGKGPVAGKGLLVPPPSFKDDRLKEMVNGKIFAAITNGVNNGNMASYASQIPVEDRWAIIAYLRQDVQKTVLEPKPGAVAVASDKPTAEYGAALYKQEGCNACHSIDGSKLVGPSFKGLWGKTESTSAGDVKVDEAYLKESVLNPMAKVVTGFPPAMPARPLNDLQISSLALYFQTLQ